MILAVSSRLIWAERARKIFTLFFSKFVQFQIHVTRKFKSSSAVGKK